MSMYDDMKAFFPGFSHFYMFTGGTFTQALELCGRLTGNDGQVSQRNGLIIFAVRHSVGTEIPWLTPVEGQIEEPETE
jgi:hypothetical protein